jgi:hypothetical protein
MLFLVFVGLAALFATVSLLRVNARHELLAVALLFLCAALTLGKV